MNQFEHGLLDHYQHRQAGVEKLRKAVASATDPLDIVNAFACTPSMEIPLLHPYWERRICALAEMIVASRPVPPEPEMK